MSYSNSKFRNFISNFISYQEKEDYHFDLPETKLDKSLENNTCIVDTTGPIEEKIQKQSIYESLSDNENYIKVRYNAMINSDIILRDFTLTIRNKQYNGFLLYIDGMVDSKMINESILTPLMLRNRANIYDGPQEKVVSAPPNRVTVKKVKSFDLADYISNCLVPQNTIKKVETFNDLVSGVNSGNCALFVDTLPFAFDIEVKGFKQRSIDTPNNEIVIRGSQEAFVEVIRTNTSMLRRIVNNENLVIENIEIGDLSNTKCAVCYMKNIANEDLVAEVKYRLNNLEIDYLLSSGQLEQLIEDNGKYSIPQMLSTERPDKATNYLLEGRVVILVNGSPYSLAMPATFLDFVSSPEDSNLKFQFANLLKVIRIFALFIALLLPGIYVAITNYHQELIPTELLYTIVATRETVPFPIIFEILIMELSFELIREAGLRVPSPIGPTIGIVGALVLGQAAVSASVVSPILIIIVAITGICSFAIPDFSLSFHIRLIRFLFIITGYFLGFLGISISLFVYLAIMSSLKSFGVPFLVPYAPVTNNSGATYFVKPIWKRENRADFLNTKKRRAQKRISMKWKYGDKI